MTELYVRDSRVSGSYLKSTTREMTRVGGGGGLRARVYACVRACGGGGMCMRGFMQSDTAMVWLSAASDSATSDEAMYASARFYSAA